VEGNDRLGGKLWRLVDANVISQALAERCTVALPISKLLLVSLRLASGTNATSVIFLSLITSGYSVMAPPKVGAAVSIGLVLVGGLMRNVREEQSTVKPNSP
jgi:hypothetical protein